MSELGIYEGCYAVLANGEIVGPVVRDTRLQMNYDWICAGIGCWFKDGRIGAANKRKYAHNIMRVLDPVAVPLCDRSEAPQGMVSTIPPHVTKAAMDAGIKADPAYEQFVNAILTAGFKAQYGIGFVPVTEQAPVSVTDGLLEQMASVFGDKGFYELGDAAQQKLRGAAECAVAFFGGNQVVPKNESENRIPDSEKPKGGLSDFLPFYEPGLAEKITDTGREVLKSMLPLNGVTICFTGSMNIPVDTHKGIAEALGAKVSGSVHSKTTLVVFGVGASSKLHKAIELDLPRMSESTWMWMAALLGYGKPDHVSPYGKFTGKNDQSDLRNEIVRVLRDNDTIRGIGATADAIMKIVEGVQVGAPAIPSLREIHDEVLAEVRDWHAKYGRDSMPSTFSIAKAFHRMLAPTAVEEPVLLVAPEGWYLYECKHEHTAHRFAGQTVTPSDHPGGAWSVDFQRLANGGMLTGGRGKTLVEAWQNAVAAIKLAEEHGLDI